MSIPRADELDRPVSNAETALEQNLRDTSGFEPSQYDVNQPKDSHFKRTGRREDTRHQYPLETMLH